MIRCTDLRKRYGDVQALDGVSLEITPGEIFGVIGPNGAGKSTLLECLEGLRRPDSGSIEVLGVDPAVTTAEIRRRTGLQLQTAALPSRLKVGEALRLFSSFYDTPADWRRLLQQLGLQDTTTAYVDDLSGGQRQRVFIALALLNDPEIVFVDEITTGLDPKARHLVWDIVRGIRADGATVVMTTHFMEEAERLCDRVAVVDRGRIVALGTVPELVASAGAESTMTMTLGGAAPTGRLEAVPGVTTVATEHDRVTVRGTGRLLAQQVITTLTDADVTIVDLAFREPNLEDAFLALTGGAHGGAAG